MYIPAKLSYIIIYIELERKENYKILSILNHEEGHVEKKRNNNEQLLPEIQLVPTRLTY